MTCVNSLQATTNILLVPIYGYRDKFASAGKVVAIVEEPYQTGEEKV